MNLYFSYYHDNSDLRRQELQKCIKINVCNKSFKKIYIINETCGPLDFLEQQDNIVILNIPNRITFKDVFMLSNYSAHSDINVLINTDIIIPDNFDISLKEKQVFCISRYDMVDNDYKITVGGGSHDCWAWKGKIDSSIGDFYMGKYFCDGILANQLYNAGYILKNPALSLVLHHVHGSGIRNYTTTGDYIAGQRKGVKQTLNDNNFLIGDMYDDGCNNSNSSNYFITFGAGSANYIDAGKRLISQATDTEIFDKIILYSRETLESDVDFWNKHSKFIESNPKGYGYWLWKPYLILKTLKKMKTNDVLLYCSAGCEIEIAKKSEIVNMINQTKKDYIIGSYWDGDGTEGRWTKKDLFGYLDLPFSIHSRSPIRQTVSICLMCCEKTIKLVEEWYSVASEYHLLDDSPSINKEVSIFVEHRYDQSIFSLLTKKYNIYSKQPLPKAIHLSRNNTGNSTIKNNIKPLKHSYSQLEQDLKILKQYKFKQNGYFIEIGANDGITLSNTYLLEKKYNWKGICIEPIPEKYEQLKINRNSICINKAIYNSSNLKLDFTISHGIDGDLLSGITNHIDCHKNETTNAKKITVETITLDDLLKQSSAPKFIDYLSIDTEGSEFEILKNINFNNTIFGIIHVEHNYIEPRRTQMRELLSLNNYTYLCENKWDDEYIHNSIK